MPISYNSTSYRLDRLAEKMRREAIIIPPHQRDFVWSLRRQRRLVQAVRRGKPIPSVLFRELPDDKLSLEDGQQRLKTLTRYIDNLFDVDKVFYRDFTPLDQERFLTYSINVVQYTGATDEEAREIFNDIQTGQCLTFGERIFSVSRTAPIARYAVERLLTPGQHFYERIAAIMGEGRTPKARRGSDMATAYALCAGLAHGIDYLSRKPDDADACLHLDIDEAAIDAKLEHYVQIWEEVHRRAPVTTQYRRKEYWDLGTFGGYIAYSFELVNGNNATGVRIPVTTREELVGIWADYIVSVYHDPALFHRVLHRDIDAARSWKLARWSNGLRRLFPDVNIPLMEDSDDDDDSD